MRSVLRQRVQCDAEKSVMRSPLRNALVLLLVALFCPSSRTEQAAENVSADALLPPQGTLADVVSSGSLEKVKLLIASGSDVNQRNAAEFTPLMLACEKGYYFSATELLKAGAIASHHDSRGVSALTLAVSGNFTEIVSALLDVQADPNTTNSMGLTVTMQACKLNYPVILKLLVLNGADLNKRTPAGDSALHFAAIAGYLQLVSILLAAGSDAECVQSSGHTPLMLAASRGHADVIAELISHGVNIDRRDGIGMSALDHAIYRRQLTSMKLLAEAGAEMARAGISMNEESRLKREISLWKKAHPHQLHRLEEL